MPLFHDLFLYEIRVTKEPTSLISETMIYFCHVTFFSFFPLLFLSLSLL